MEPGFKRNGSSAAATTEAARNEKRQLPARGSGRGSGRDGDRGRGRGRGRGRSSAADSPGTLVLALAGATAATPKHIAQARPFYCLLADQITDKGRDRERERTQESESDIYTYMRVCGVCVCSYLPLYLGEFAGSRNEFSTILLYRVVFSFFLFGFQCRAYSLTCSRSCSLSLSRSLSFSLCACTFSQLSMPCCKSISCLCVCVWVLYAYPAHTDAHTLKMFISWHCPLEIIISHAQNRPLDLLNYPEEWRHVCSRRREERTPAINSDS